MLKFFVALLILGHASTLVAEENANEKTLEATVVNGKGSSESQANAVADDATSQTREYVSTCTKGSGQRSVEVSFAATASQLPCQVHYKKQNAGAVDDQVIYSANNSLQYCQEKAAAHVAKLETMGWSCSKG